MNRRSIKLTTSQFAKIHAINKRTLHYYDTIGLFSPHSKGDNNYRYYDDSQGIQLEHIRMLKELNMSIKEIKEYLNNPNQADFLRIADTKLKEIDREIRRLKKSKQILLLKKKQLELCSQIKNREIRIIEYKKEHYQSIPFTWDGLPEFYEEIMAFAEKHHLTLTGYAYETGLIDFVISSADEYITQIMIQAETEER